MNMLLLTSRARVPLDERELRQIRDRLVGRPRVRHHQRMLAVGVLEKVINTVVLHYAAAERQIGFAILDAVGYLVKVAGGAEYKVGKSRLFEHLRNDFLDVLAERSLQLGETLILSKLSHQRFPIEAAWESALSTSSWLFLEARK